MAGQVALAAGSAVAGAVGGLLLNRGWNRRRLRKALGSNFKLFSQQERTAALSLLDSGGQHLFSSWPPRGVHDEQKRRLLRVAAAQTQGRSADVETARQEVLRVPKAIKKPFKVGSPVGHTREDPYYWLRDDERKDPEILAYLQAENDYAKAMLLDTEQLQKDLVAEMRARIQEADQSAPVREQGYFYYSRTLEGQQYRVHCRKQVPISSGPPSENDELPSSEEGEEEILLDENAEAAKHSFYIVGALETSPDHKLLAYAEDTTGGEKYTLHVRELATGKQLLKRPIENTSGNLTWALDNQTLFYVTKDKIDRPFQLWRHRIGTDPSEDVTVFREDDEQFTIHIYRSRDDKLLLLGTGSAITSDVQYLDASQPEGSFQQVLPRQHNTEYDAWHRNGHIFLLVRDEARPNSELQVASLDSPSQTQVLVAHRDDVKIESVSVSKNFAVVFERLKGLQVATVYKLPASGAAPDQLTGGQQVKFEEPAYELGPGEQGDFDSNILRLTYTSLTTPATVLDHNMATGNRTTKKVTPVLGGFDSANYKTERQWATAEDGTRVPFSFVYRKGVARLDGTDPVLLNGYGSYEICNDPYFARDKLSLIDRGFIFAMAHIRGGGEMGRQWYEQGKYEHKKNTFTDFIAVAQHLIDNKVTTAQHLCIEGRSAGGLLIGAVLNMRPDLFAAAIAGVPFVDVVTTMLDESIPLTAGEWEEWGCPKEQKFYDYMLSYSPVDNVQQQAYPHILVTAGLWDPRVAYWEPAKWVAKLRAHKTDSKMLVMKCNLGAGHFSESGRFDRLKETAIEFAFLLKVQSML